jgi:hypothetical protein
VRQSPVTEVHAFEDDGTTDWRGQKICHRCSLPKDIDRHQLPEVPPEVAEVEARRLGETP